MSLTKYNAIFLCLLGIVLGGLCIRETIILDSVFLNLILLPLIVLVFGGMVIVLLIQGFKLNNQKFSASNKEKENERIR